MLYIQTLHNDFSHIEGDWRRKSRAEFGLVYDGYSTKRYRNILRHELELKWINLLQTPYPLGLNDTIYHENYISRLPDFDVFLFSFGYL